MIAAERLIGATVTRRSDGALFHVTAYDEVSSTFVLRPSSFGVAVGVPAATITRDYDGATTLRDRDGELLRGPRRWAAIFARGVERQRAANRPPTPEEALRLVGTPAAAEAAEIIADDDRLYAFYVGDLDVPDDVAAILDQHLDALERAA